MKGAPAHFKVPNLKGKKSHSFACGCCSAVNDKEKLLYKIEMIEAKETIDNIKDPCYDVYSYEYDME